VYVVDLNVQGNYYRIPRVAISDAGVYECFVNNSVRPTTLAKMRVDVLCKFMLLKHHLPLVVYVSECLVKMSESQHKGNNAPSLRIQWQMKKG